MHNTSPSYSKVISVDKYLFETKNLMGDFLVSLIGSLQTEGYLGPIQISLAGLFWKTTNVIAINYISKNPPS